MADCKSVFAFDLGKASIGEAVRIGKGIVHAAALLIPAEFASTKDQAQRRRAKRTRDAHKAREAWLNRVCREVGIEVLEGRKPGNRKKGIPATRGDARLEREFGPPGDTTCYTSCILRIRLLRGEHLESWQVYKALHSAIQRRGYDSDIAWRTAAAGEPERTEDEDQESTEKLSAFLQEYRAMCPRRPECQYLCYYDAWKMGLWDPKTNELTGRIDNRAGRARGYVAPRSEVEKEVRSLLEQAAQHYPRLVGRADYVLYGPANKPYASYYEACREEYGLRRGSESDWQGILSQKVPRFDNRIVDKCALIPRLNVCRAKDPLYWHVAFLLGLKNLRFLRDGKQQGLSPEEIREWFEKALKDDQKRRQKAPREKRVSTAVKAYKVTAAQWRKWCEKHGAVTVPTNEKVDEPRMAGRCRFSRPALQLVRDLILLGENPQSFHGKRVTALAVNSDPKRGLTARDLRFLLVMPDDWDRIHIPQMRGLLAPRSKREANEAIRKLLGSQKDPVVRHRLEMFWQRLQVLEGEFGCPDMIAIEFVREDFMGEKAKRRLEKYQKQRKKEHEQARADVESLNIAGKSSVLKMELLRQQAGACLYTGGTLTPTELDTLEIDHVVPRGEPHYGCDALFNKVLTTHDANKDKGKRTPMEWLCGTGRWEAYLSRVKAQAGSLGTKKARLLVSEDAPELCERYTALAETAWIARVSQSLVHLHFGWGMGEKGQKRRVVVIPGGLTARVRRRHKLDRLLVPEGVDAEAIEGKYRDDDRHHALDAMVLSYIPSWAVNPKKEGFFTFPEGVDATFLRDKLETVIPQFLCREKPRLEETIYAKRKVNGEDCAVVHRGIADLPTETGKFSASKGLRRARDILDKRIRGDLVAFFEGNPSEEEWQVFLESYSLEGAESGSKVRRVACRVGAMEELADLSKNVGDGSRGQWRRSSTHKGYFVYANKRGTAKVRPVYVHESFQAVRDELKTEGVDKPEYFCSNCIVSIERDVVLPDRTIPAGQYVCSTIKQNGTARLRGPQPFLQKTIGLTRLLQAGLRRVPSET